MDTLIVGAMATVLAALVFFLARATYGVWQGAVLDRGGPLPIHRMMERHGIRLAAIDGRALAQAAVATRRCAACRNRSTCAAWLAAGATTGYERFCPNAGFIARLKA